MADDRGLRGTCTRAGVAFAVIVLLCPGRSPPVGAASVGGPPKLLIITFDGFGWNFLSKTSKSRTPNFHTVMEKGVHLRWMENVFPTKTLPNHMSMVSGLYPESHGVVNNKFFDPVLNASMPRKEYLRTSEWIDTGAEPVWVTNSKAGGGRRSGAVYWPCSQDKIKGRIPEELKKEEPGVSSKKVTYTQRIDIALDWLSGESSDRVNFAAVYTHGVDGVSHKYGPDSQEMVDAIVMCDDAVGHLLTRMKEKKLEDELNVIITADHGHSAIYPQLMVNIDELLDPSWYFTYPNIDEKPRLMVNLWPYEEYHDKVVEALKGDHLNMHVAIKGKSEELVALHYSANRRIAPVVLYAEPGWVIGRTNGTFKSGKGEHGWDPRYDPYMYPMFMAMGPAFKKGVRDAEPFHIVDVYPLMCHILGLDPAPNNGSLSNAQHILRPQSPRISVGVAVGIVVALVCLAVVLSIIIKLRNSRKITVAYRRVFTSGSPVEDLVDDGKVDISDEEL